MNFAKQQYCQISDVTNLLSNVDGYDDSASNVPIAISNATSFIDTATNRVFSPVRKVVQMDYSSVFVLNSPIIAINSITIGTNVFSDSDVQIDRNSGLVNVPSNKFYNFDINWSNFFQPQMIVDYISGETQLSFDEVLTTSDNLTFSFANSCIPYTVPGSTDSYPVVSVNGVIVSNYSLNSAINGANSITFTSAVSGTVTATYPYSVVDPQIISATAKLASVELLTAFAITGGFTNAVYQGTSIIQMDSSFINVGNGQFSNKINQYKEEALVIIKNFKRYPIGG